MKVIIPSALLLSMASFAAHAQTVVFEETFGTPAGRERSVNTPTGANSFVYGDPNHVYPLPKPEEVTWTGDLNEYQLSAKTIENNHYAIVAPANVYSSITSWIGSATAPTMWYTWADSYGTPDVVAITEDASGNPNGDVFSECRNYERNNI